MPGIFVTFEGLDGSGKSTHLRRAAAWLAERGVDCAVTREPGGTEVGRRIREVFLSPSRDRLDGLVETLLVFASRRQNLLEVIEPALAAGRHVLCDRFTDSTRVYQGVGGGVARRAIDAVDRVATGGRRPDATLLFDLPAEEARRRVEASRSRGEEEGNRFDVGELDVYRHLRRAYLELARAEPERFRVIASDRPMEETEAEVRAVLGRVLAVGGSGLEVPGGRG